MMNEENKIMNNPIHKPIFVMRLGLSALCLILGTFLIFDTGIKFFISLFFLLCGSVSLVITIYKGVFHRPTSVLFHDDGMILRFHSGKEKRIVWDDIIWVMGKETLQTKFGSGGDGSMKAKGPMSCEISYEIAEEIRIRFKKRMGYYPLSYYENEDIKFWERRKAKGLDK